MDIVHVSPELAPFSKIGGLGDVAAALPVAQKAAGHKVTVLSPRYGGLDTTALGFARRLVKVKFAMGSGPVSADVHEGRLPSGLDVVLLGVPGVSDRPGVYGEGASGYPDNHLRFGAFARAVVGWLRLQPKLPEVLHLHDWTGGIVPALLKEAAAEDPRFAAVKTVFTLHNLAHQGRFSPATLADLGLGAQYAAHDAWEFYGDISWMKAAVLGADEVVTVSPTYAREVLTPAMGHAMDGILKAQRPNLEGILNGIDTRTWDPATDPHLAVHFGPSALVGKRRNKTALQARLGLAQRPEAAVLGLVARLDPQKGVDLVVEAAAQLVRQDLQLVVQGAGDPALSAALQSLARALPDRVFYTDARDEALAHQIYAASDFFLVPSRFEPCGLTQMYAMRYGAVPIVRATGGLVDTVIDLDPSLQTGTGFVFEAASAEALSGAVGRALTAYQHPNFSQVITRVMRQDHGWERAARHYLTRYEALLAPASA